MEILFGDSHYEEKVKDIGGLLENVAEKHELWVVYVLEASVIND